MFTPISVSISGPAFSFLLYESSKCRFQQEGFLLGEVIHKETRTITDNDQQQINITKTIKINSVLPCPQNHFFYEGTGRIHGDKIRDFLGGQFTKVVAWYKFQRAGTTLKLTMRDKVIHKQLTELFGIPSEIFTCGLLGTEVSETRSTYSFCQHFIRCYNMIYEKLPVHIPNLSEPNHTYKSSEPASQTFNKLLVGLQVDRKNTQGLQIVHKIQKSLQNHTDSVLKTLSQAESKLYELEEELKDIRMSINQQKNRNIKKSNKTKEETHTNVDVIKNNETIMKKNEGTQQENKNDEMMDISFDNTALLDKLAKKQETKLGNNCTPKEDSSEIQIKTFSSPKRRGRGKGKAREGRDIR